MPHAPAARPLGRKAVPEQRGDKNHRPLHALCLVYRHDADGIGVGVLVVLPALGVVILRAILEKVRKGCVLVHRLRTIMDRLKIRNELAKLAEVVEDYITATIRYAFLTDPGVLKKSKEQPLDRVQTPALLILFR